MFFTTAFHFKAQKYKKRDIYENDFVIFFHTKKPVRITNWFLMKLTS